MKNRLSYYLQRVKQGETLVIRERNTPVARLVPLPPGVPEEIASLLEGGLASWQGGKPAGCLQPPGIPQGRELAALVAEDRR